MGQTGLLPDTLFVSYVRDSLASGIWDRLATSLTTIRGLRAPRCSSFLYFGLGAMCTVICGSSASKACEHRVEGLSPLTRWDAVVLSYDMTTFGSEAEHGPAGGPPSATNYVAFSFLGAVDARFAKSLSPKRPCKPGLLLLVRRLLITSDLM